MLVEWHALLFLGAVFNTSVWAQLQARMFCIRGHILVWSSLMVPWGGHRTRSTPH